jgi:hypothetical protein
MWQCRFGFGARFPAHGELPYPKLSLSAVFALQVVSRFSISFFVASLHEETRACPASESGH